jgi:YbgC/YbaW family acyl-CoA thioester hydrolase
MTPFHITRRVEFHETDMAGIVHFASFYCFMEFAEVEFLRSRGLSVVMCAEGDKVGFPRVSATCDFFKPARFDEVLDIAVTIERLGTKSVTYGFEFARDGEVLARGKVTSVCCRVGADHRLDPVPIPAWYRERLEGRD